MRLSTVATLVLCLLSTCVGAWNLTIYSEKNHKGKSASFVGTGPRSCTKVPYKGGQIKSLQFEGRLKCYLEIHTVLSCLNTTDPKYPRPNRLPVSAEEYFERDKHMIQGKRVWFEVICPPPVQCLKPSSCRRDWTGFGEINPPDGAKCKDYCKGVGLRFSHFESLESCDHPIWAIWSRYPQRCCCKNPPIP
jgi:hypothetical protein